MTNKYALFDFCETLVDFQTADAFIDYVRERKGSLNMRFWEVVRKILCRLKIIQICERITQGKKSIHKRVKLLQLRGVDFEEVDALAKGYYNNKIKPHLIKQMITELNSLKSDGYKIGLVSGGYNVYLKFFVEDYNLDFCLCTKIMFRDNKCQGKFIGKDCLRDNKLIYLNNYFTVAPEISVSYSDSISDIPLLKWTSSGIVVSHKRHQKWVEDNNFKEIIW